MFDNKETRTVNVRNSEKTVLRKDFLIECLLVTSNVFDIAAKDIRRTGPRIGWKDAASLKLSDVFPNQICVRSQVIDRRDRGGFES